MTRTVILTYFKESGKWYSEGQYETKIEEYHDWLIHAEVRKMRIEGKLPGLCRGAREFHILVNGENIVPQLLLTGTDT